MVALGTINPVMGRTQALGLRMGGLSKPSDQIDIYAAQSEFP